MKITKLPAKKEAALSRGTDPGACSVSTAVADKPTHTWKVNNILASCIQYKPTETAQLEQHRDARPADTAQLVQDNWWATS
jgi:hypothetical protein